MKQGVTWEEAVKIRAAFENEVSDVTLLIREGNTVPIADSTIKSKSGSSGPIPVGELPLEWKSPPKEEPSKSDNWWDNFSAGKKTLAVLGILLAVVVVIVFLWKFWLPLFGILMIAGLVMACFSGSKEERIEAKKTVIKLVIGAIIICIGVCVFVWKPDLVANIFQPGVGVRNAYLEQYSKKVTVEHAFDAFFDDGKWDTYNEKGYSYVVFTGVCEYLGKRADVKITFKITGENFIVDSLDLNGIEQSNPVLYGLLTEVYEKY